MDKENLIEMREISSCTKGLLWGKREYLPSLWAEGGNFQPNIQGWNGLA